MRVYGRAVVGFLRTRARRAGIANGRSGAVAIIQRFGSALNLNVHTTYLRFDPVALLTRLAVIIPRGWYAVVTGPGRIR